MPRTTLTALTALLLLTGCKAGLRDELFPTGSSTIINSSDHTALYAVNVDEGTVSRFDVATGAVTQIEVGREPTRLTRAAGKVYVTLRADRAIAMLEETAGGLELKKVVSTGAEPMGIVASEDGRHVYVALSAQDEVQELDGNDLSVQRTWTADNHPAWLALHPSGDTLWIGSILGGDLSYVDLSSSGSSVQDFTFPEQIGAGSEQNLPFAHRLTGDVDISPDGHTIAVPGLFVDNETPVGEPDPGTVQQGSGYASTVGIALSRINPGVTLIDLDNHGRPEMDSTRTAFIAGFGLEANSDSTSIVRSFPSSVTFAPDGETMYATMEASSQVVALSTATVFTSESLCDICNDVSDTGALTPSQGGFTSSPSVFIATAAGPRGVAFVDDENAYVHAFLDRNVASLRAGEAADAIAEQFRSGSTSQVQHRALSPVQIAQPSLDPQIEAGRRLFFSATTPQMSASGSGVSCSTCHFEGRNDGLSWPLENGPRQTPNLAVNVDQTAPVTWTSEVPSVSSEAQITSEGRMGGNGLTDGDAAAISAFINSQREVDHAGRQGDPAAIERGRAIFNREDVACGTCHNGSYYTDNQAHDLYGLEAVNTPGLRGIAYTAPYLHDGSVATLEDLLDQVRAGVMGDTSMLSDSEMSDLLTYLKSL